jgi:hypothetical protein
MTLTEVVVFLNPFMQMPEYFIHCSPVPFPQILTVTFFIGLIILLRTIYAAYLFYLPLNFVHSSVVSLIARNAALSKASLRRRFRSNFVCISS